ncbi:LytR/AlgR family response regulator transcription factor [Paenibacillus periandrae]|uniref:LytR/AlgR family response regulator transcription factor n=1 Tax=Paenibacillus periandrae TaxID=1761741 RepID=UPI001F09E903|nr:LytTR family DNA-binding domain-containing protein [Paenibacillus periandrae]
MKIKTIIAEDDLSQRTVLNKFAIELGLDVVCTVSSGTRLVEEVVQRQPDLLLLDISLIKLNGLDAYRQILTLGLNPNVIIISGSIDSKHLVAGFEVGSVDYIVKPYTFERFSKAINKAKHAIETKHLLPSNVDKDARLILMKQKYRELQLKEDQIIFVEKCNTFRNRTNVYLTNGTIEETTTQLSEIKERCSEKIVYSHRSFLINLIHVAGIQPDKLITKAFVIQFENTIRTAPLSRRKYNEILEYYERFRNS